VYLEPWHPDVEEFLELRDSTGEETRRTHNLNLANWVPDEFMRRVEADQPWSLFDPDQVPELVDRWGGEFDATYRKAESEGRYARQVQARDLYLSASCWTTPAAATKAMEWPSGHRTTTPT
jgi:ribonucleoside-diphosphate reductase alpha chain